MRLVNSVDDIRKNLETFHGCLFSKSGKERFWAGERLRSGHNLVGGHMKGRVTFGPSRFIGSQDNNRARHRSEQRDGGSTDIAIDKVLDRIKSGQPDWKRLEDLFQELCDCPEVKPDDRRRTYWDLDYDSGFVDLDRSYVEGRRFPAVVMRTERSAAARMACIKAHDNNPSCVVCGFNFAEFYGEHGEGFIHVHHLRPLAEGARKVVHARDLVPVCPNCHYMLHRNGLLKPEKLRGMMLKTPCSSTTSTH